jgi:ATP-dependent phosphoenolpyruvate carboxykinase
MISSICVIHYKGTPTIEDISYKNNKTKEYIINKINNYKASQQIMHQKLITALPHF